MPRPPLLLLLLRLCCLSAQTEHAGRRAFLLQSPANKPVVLPIPDPLSPATPTAAGVTWTPAMLSGYLFFLQQPQLQLVSPVNLVDDLGSS